jgi:hypothetical protein
LNLRRKGGAHDVNQQLLQLKEENAKLKFLAGNLQDYEHMKLENNIMRQELQKLKSPSQSDGFIRSSFQNKLAIESGNDYQDTDEGEQQQFFVTAGPDTQANAFGQKAKLQQQKALNYQIQQTANNPAHLHMSPMSVKTVQDGH